MGTYTFLPHTADEKFEVEATTLEEGFSLSAKAFNEILVGKEEIKEQITKEIHITAKKLRSLLYDFLNELVFLFDEQDLLLPHVKNITIQETTNGYELQASVAGDKRQNYELITEIKNMTYSDMIVEKQGNHSWKLVVVVDI